MREKKSGRSLRLKTILFSGGLLVLLVLLFGTLGSRELLDTFRNLQQSLLDQQIERFKGQLRNIGRLKELLVREYAEWDETYDFLEGTNPGFLAEYFEPGKITNGEDVLILFDRERRMVATRFLKVSASQTSLSPENLRKLTDTGFLQEGGQRLGCLVENGRVLLVAAGPVLRNDRSGPPAGWLVYGRWIDADWLNETFDLIGMHVKGIDVMRGLDAVHPPPRSAGVSLTGVDTWVAVKSTGDSRYEAKIVLPLLGDSQVVAISVAIPMDVLGAAVRTRNDLFVLGIIGGLCLVLLPLVAFEWLVLRRLASLDQDIQRITDSGVASSALEVAGNDEIARLAGSINRLMESERQAMEKLKLAEGNSRAIFEAIGDPIFVHGYDASGFPTKFYYVNEGACKFLNRSHSELLKMGPGEVDEESVERVQTVSRELAETGSSTFETLLIASDGTRIPVEIHANDTSLSGERVCIAVARSLVVRKIIDARMREAKEAAEAANRAKSEFLATMSHEIRTPLHGVIGFAALLRNSDLPDHLREAVEGISDSADLLLALVTDVLDFSRIEAGQLSLHLAPIDLRRQLKRLCSSTRLRAEEKRLEFEYVEDPSLPSPVLADFLRIEQVLGNLLGNALKFTERGKITLEVRAKAVKEGAFEIKFIVSDTGIGIGPEQMPRLFNPFSQADSSLTRRYGGSGLGLVIVKRLCELMGGTVALKSELGKGSEFTAAILVHGVDDQASAALNGSRPARREADQQTLQVLVVEDNQLNQKLMRRLIEQQGCQVESASNGREAVELVAKQDFDLVFMDVSMPGMDGHEATRAVRRQEQESGSRSRFIVALTAGVSEGEREACREAGMDDFLGKPFTEDGLKGILQKARERRFPPVNVGIASETD